MNQDTKFFDGIELGSPVIVIRKNPTTVGRRLEGIITAMSTEHTLSGRYYTRVRVKDSDGAEHNCKVTDNLFFTSKETVKEYALKRIKELADEMAEWDV